MPNIEWTPRLVAKLLLIVGLVTGIGGFANHYFSGGKEYSIFGDLLEQFYANICVDFVGLGITILVIDRLYERVEKQRQYRTLLTEAASTVNDVSLRAIERLREEGILTNGDLYGNYFGRANWQNADLHLAELVNANLSNAQLTNVNFNLANLQGADFSSSTILNVQFITADLSNSRFGLQSAEGVDFQDANLDQSSFLIVDLSKSINLSLHQMIRTKTLYRSILPGIGFYDGRFNFADDLDSIPKMGFNPNIAADVAAFYGVSEEQYLTGQEWARTNLSDLHRAASVTADRTRTMRGTFLRGDVYIDPDTGDRFISIQ